MHFNQCCSTNKRVGRDQVEWRRQGVPGAAENLLCGPDDQRRFPQDADRGIAKRNEELYENYIRR